MMKEKLLNFLVLTISLVITLIVCEIVVKIILPQNLTGSFKNQTEDGLWANKSHGSIRHQFNDRTVHYRFYPPHLRDTQQKPESTQILVLGDSFTFGTLLEKENTYIDHLQRSVDSVFGPDYFNFINAASSGWGTDDYLAYTEEFGDVIAPEIVLIFLNTDDIGRSINSDLYAFVDPTNLQLKRLKTSASFFKKIVNHIPGYNWFLEHFHLVQLIRKAGWLLVLPSAQTNTEKPDRLTIEGPNSKAMQASRKLAISTGQTLFLRLKDWCAQRGIWLFVLTTGWHSPPYTEFETEPTRAFMSTAPIFFDQHAIAFHDISSQVYEIRRMSPELFIIEGEGHPNETGSRLIADHAWLFLKDKLAEYCRVTRTCK